MMESLPLTLYHNGLALYQGPFRPYSDPSTRQLIQDLSDGYFPSELQQRYPEGVPLVISDQRDVWFCSRQSLEHFPGSGHLLGENVGPSRILPAGSDFRRPPRGMKETSQLPGKILSAEQLLSKLPHSVVRGGRVLEIRGGIRDALQAGGSGHNSSVTPVDTPVVTEMKNRLEVTEGIRPPTPSHLTTLRVKNETGEKTYILKMKYTESIGNLRTYLNKLRTMNSPCDYMLKTTFPSRVLDDLSATLVDCGLVPTATVYMVKRSHCSKKRI